MSSNSYEGTVDHRLSGSFTREGMKGLLRLTSQCINLSSRKRPQVQFVVSELERIFEKEMKMTTVMGEGTAVVTLGSQLFTSSKWRLETASAHVKISLFSVSSCFSSKDPDSALEERFSVETRIIHWLEMDASGKTNVLFDVGSRYRFTSYINHLKTNHIQRQFGGNSSARSTEAQRIKNWANDRMVRKKNGEEISSVSLFGLTLKPRSV